MINYRNQVILKQGIHLLYCGEFNRAILTFRYLLRFVEYTQSLVYYYMGQCCFYQFDIMEAFRYFQLSLATDKIVESYYFLGAIYNFLDNESESIHYYKRAVLESQDGLIRLMSLRVIQDKITIDEKTVFQEICNRDYSVKINNQDYFNYLKRGLKKEIDGNFKGAIEDFEFGVSENPHYFLNYIFLAEIFLKQGKYDQSILIFKDIAQKFSKNLMIYPLYSKVLFFSEKYRYSAHFLKKILKRFKGNYKLHFNLALVYYKSQNYQKAIYHFQQSLNLNPYFFPTLYNLGVLYQKTGNLQRAIEHYEKALLHYFQEQNLYYNLAFCFFITQDYEKSFIHILKYLKLKPEDQDALNLKEHIILKTKVLESNNSMELNTSIKFIFVIALVVLFSLIFTLLRYFI